MSRSHPYQPLLLRLFHNAHALLVLGALITGFWVYNTYDGRFGKLSLPAIPDIIGIHGTFGVFFFLLTPAFALYAFHAGQQRLIQPDSLSQLTQIGKPVGWFSLHRVVNTLMLLASVFSALSGRMMQEAWLPAGHLDHAWYSMHLIAWVVMLTCLAVHLLMVLRVGGNSLLMSMVNFQVHPGDRPVHWVSRLRRWLRL